MGKITDKQKEDVEFTVMAIRERVMEYYKGTCVNRMDNPHNIGLRIEDSAPARYNYQRQAIRQQDGQKMYIGNVWVASLQKSPHMMVLRNNKLQRSPQLEAVKAGVMDFMGRYLRAVEVKQQGRRPAELTDDSDLIARPDRDVTASHPFSSFYQSSEVLNNAIFTLTPRENVRWNTLGVTLDE